MNIAMQLDRALRGALSCLLAAALIAAGGPVSANDQSVDKVKTALTKIGTGEKSRVTVKLKSGTVIKGHIGVLDKEDFTIVSKEATQRVLYSDVEKVKKQGMNPGITIAIAAGLIVGIVLIVMYAACGSEGCH